MNYTTNNMTNYLKNKIESLKDFHECYEGHKDKMIERFVENDKRFTETLEGLDNDTVLCTSHTLKSCTQLENKTTNFFNGRRFTTVADEVDIDGSIVTVGTEREEFQFFLDNDFEILDSFNEDLSDLYLNIYLEREGCVVIHTKSLSKNLRSLNKKRMFTK
tara:strand:- start:200 stop:682 length:483 start_codon:yes stop_codon:yes gene_type:complete